jgi:ubiquinone/menaquinone biosynthesis C-methylase UbiE
VYSICMDWQSQTIKTYDDSANELAEYFKGIGARVDDIELGLKLADIGSNAQVVEIGCGDRRDAVEIVKRVGKYEGFDPSEGLLKIAHKRLPNVSFVKADALSYVYPKKLDVVYAFASLLHVNLEDLKKVFEKVSQSLRPGGVFFISLKERTDYVEEVKEDEYGKRIFYYYNPAIIKEVAGTSFTSIYEDHQKIGKTDWFTIVLKKD